MVDEENEDGDVCLVPARGDIWPTYLGHGVFITAAGKSFRAVPRFAFYTSRLVRPLAPAVLQVLDHVPLQDEVIARLWLSTDPTRQRVGESLAAAAEASTSDDPVKLVLLTKAADARTVDFGEIEHHGRGPWVRTRRYMSLATLAAATTTSDVNDGGEQ